MSKLINFFKKDKLKLSVAIVILIVLGIVVLVVGSTYATSSYTIVFNRAENTEVMKSCKTDENGKLDQDCITTISTVCNRWSPEPWYGSNYQDDQIYASQFANMTFTKDTNYYCVAGTSGKYDMGCYVCKTDSNIMHWAANGNSDSNCSSGYNKVSKPQAECVTVIPDSCYVCKENSNVMKWDNNGDSDNSCSSGYDPIDKPRNECVTIIPDSCYVCKENSNVMKWDNNGDSDNSCSSGYTPVNKPKNECATITENPKTGNILIFVVWSLGLGALIYSLYYHKNIRFEN